MKAVVRGRVVTGTCEVLDRALTRAVMARRGVRGTSGAAKFHKRGRKVRFDPDGVYTFKTITVGDNVDLGYRPILIATKSHIRIGDNVMFGPEVTMRGGNHRIDLQGLPMVSVTNEMKRPEDDRGVTIGDDVWVGTRAIILHGVTVGTGADIGAGSLLTKDVPPHAIVAGAPARVVKSRFE